MEGESTRQLKVAREIQRHLAEIIRSKGMAAFDGALVSVSGVSISPDLAVAKVYVSIFPSAKQGKVFGMIQDSVRALRLRIVPELVFYLDDSLDYVEHIDELLAK